MGKVLPFPSARPCARASLLALRIENLEHIKAAFGECAAALILRTVHERAAAFVGLDGVVDFAGGACIDVLLDGHEAGGGADAVWHMLDALHAPIFPKDAAECDFTPAAGFCALVNCAAGGLDSPIGQISVIDIERLRDGLVDALDGKGTLGAPGEGEDWARRYRADMARATALHCALVEGDLCLAWQPVAEAEDAASLLYQEGLLRILAFGADGADNAAVTGLGRLGSETSLSCAPLIVAAERIGLMRRIDAWVVRQVIDQLRDQPGLNLGCNISAQSAVLDGWWSAIVDDLARSPEIARRLVIEITETAAFPRIDLAVAFADRMRRLGCTIAIDDFGTGRAAWRDVVALDPRIVKIDGAFLRRTATDAAGDAGFEELRHLIALAQCRGRQVVVEGVETASLQELAVKAGARLLQGPWVANPKLARPYGVTRHHVTEADEPSGEEAGAANSPPPIPGFLLTAIEVERRVESRVRPVMLSSCAALCFSAGLALWMHFA